MRIAARLWRITLLRSLLFALLAAAVLFIISELQSPYRNTQLDTAAYYFCALAGLTVLAGLSGQISLGHGALMAVGAYTAALLISKENWSIAPALAAATAVTAIVGVPVGAAASRLRGPYLAGATLAFAVGLPALADKFPGTFGGENGLTVNPIIPPSWLNVNPEKWEAWVACIAALIVFFVLYNVIHSGVGRAWRGVRDDEIAASLSGLRVGNIQTRAFIVSAACAGLGGALLTARINASVGSTAFQLQLSLYLLAGVVIGGLGSLAGAVWGALLLTFLPNWSDSLGHSFSLPQKVSSNLPLAIYGLVLIAAMLIWPSGIQGGLRWMAAKVRGLISGPSPGMAPAADAGHVAIDEPQMAADKSRAAS